MRLSNLYAQIEQECRESESCYNCELFRVYPDWKCPYYKVKQLLIDIADELGVDIDV